MTSSPEDRREWIRRASTTSNNITHIISVCDTFEYTDYPIMVSGSIDLQKSLEYIKTQPMQRVNEIIEL